MEERLESSLEAGSNVYRLRLLLGLFTTHITSSQWRRGWSPVWRQVVMYTGSDYYAGMS